jgi:hypothetical protein
MVPPRGEKSTRVKEEGAKTMAESPEGEGAYGGPQGKSMRTISITAREPSVPSEARSIALVDILAECSPYNNHRWIAWRVEARKSPWQMVFLVSPNSQVLMTWDQLCHYARTTETTTGGAFLAIKPNVDAEPIPKLQTIEDCARVADLVLHTINFACWHVTSSDDELLSRLARSLG